MPFSLDVTKKELELLQSLSELQSSLDQNPDNAMLLSEQNALREQLRALQEGKSMTEAYAQLMEEHQTLQNDFAKLKESFETLQNQAGDPDEKMPTSDKQRLLFYRAILEKFSPIIQEKATKTVGEIKALVDEDDLTIQALAIEFQSEETNSFWDQMKSFCAKLREHVRAVPNDVAINCWFSPQEIMENKVADDEDLAVLVATVGKAMGADEVFVVIAELTNNQSHAFALFKKDDQWGLADASQSETTVLTAPGMEEVLDSFEYENEKIKRILYRFNRETYDQFF